MADETAVASPIKVKKKLPFKPTALRRTSLPKPVSDDDQGGADDCLDLFRRSKEMEPIVAADRERRLKKKQKRDEEKRRRPSTAAKWPIDDDDAPQDTPRPQEGRGNASQERRQDEQDEQDGGLFTTTDVPTTRTVDRDSFSELDTPLASKRSRIESTPSKTLVFNMEEPDAVMVDSPSTRLLRSQSRHPLATPSKSFNKSALTPGSACVVSLDSEDDDDDDDDSVLVATPSKPRQSSSTQVAPKAPALPPLEDEEDGDEFAEYIRRAEERRARDSAMLRGEAGETRTKEAVDIFVTSTVPNAVPCRMRCLFDKPFKLVRNSWVMQQRKKGVQLSLQQVDDVILTWRRRKVYMSSTLLSLGIRPQGDGRVVVDGHGNDGLTKSQAGVHMEAWTPELFQEMEREEELRRKRETGEAEEEAAQEAPAPDIRIRVMLKARGMEDVKLTVRPETTVETLVTGFRTQRGVGSDKDIGLWFDGNRLEEHVTMEDAEIDDMDAFEVYIR